MPFLRLLTTDTITAIAIMLRWTMRTCIDWRRRWMHTDYELAVGGRRAYTQARDRDPFMPIRWSDTRIRLRLIMGMMGMDIQIRETWRNTI